jgi:hypothetical protein
MSMTKASIGALWTIAHSALYGFHISSLNGVQEAVICSDRSSRAGQWGLRGCLDLSVRQPIARKLRYRTRVSG